ncbi:efflux RND transporter permease subunit [Parazoarcus communis]|uniref:RND family transporter n=2 Tax=root TaxID=1 RepID=A0A323V1M1_9RHOO|nr:MMPL family transporter [Parazoarcus communis]NMG69678.1 MMPL family transporter [Parazoarcus communis SWub3 = DSM 12120]PZA17983.1 RND family transporter [Azoarcus communis] [Parazoarcus communis SWub3 = DSM 12120]
MSDTPQRGRLDGLIDTTALMIIRWRKALGLLFIALTMLLAYSAMNLRLDPGFNKLIPHKHEYMSAFMEYSGTFSGANRIMVSVRWKGEGDIYNAQFMKTLREITDEVFFTPGVNRASVRSLFTPNVRYIEVTEEGFNGDVVIPARFEADAASLEQVRNNVSKSGEIGRLVANDLKAALVRADLLEFNPETGERLDYADVANKLEAIRARFEGQNPDIELNIVGFAKVIGDVMDGLFTVLVFFAIAFLITAALLGAYSRSLKLVVTVLVIALMPVVWLLGLLPPLGYGIDPMSVLVPFLIFSIAVSHAIQMTNGWEQELLKGRSATEAAEQSFRNLVIPGSMALVTTALGFMVMMLIDIPILHELGVTACLGVVLMLLTNLVFLPIVLSHLKLERFALAHPIDDIHRGHTHHRFWWTLSALAKPGPALVSFAVMLALLVGGTHLARQVQTGDIGAGVPELHDDSRYNLDNARILESYSIGMDVLSVFVETTGFEEACLNWEVMNAVERFDLRMRGVEGVQSVETIARRAKLYAAGNNEANPRWAALQRSEAALRTGARAANPELGLNNAGCQTIHLIVYLTDHEASTLRTVTDEVRRFIAQDSTPNVSFRLAGGNAGVAVATNEAVDRAQVQMLVSIYGAIILICLLTFRSVRAVICIIVPLLLVSILCNALMATIDIGLKVATLPVITLGVGAGVDYGIYIYERLKYELDHGAPTLRDAFYEAMRQRGTAAIFVALTMSVGVGTWMFSALKFQADMGVLLAFMFLVNALGAMFLLPALACWLGIGRGDTRPATVGQQAQPA